MPMVNRLPGRVTGEPREAPQTIVADDQGRTPYFKGSRG